MNSTSLIQLIRESINEYIREIDEAGNIAALEAKMNKTQEAIDLREKKMNMDGIDEAYHDMIDKGKMKELASEVKALKKSLTKYEKQLDKLKNKGEKVAKAEEEEEKEIVDEMSIDGALDETAKDPESGPQLEEKKEVTENYEDVIKSNNYDYDTAHSWLEDQGLKPMEIDSILNKVFPETNEEIGIYEMLYMQKLAGIISEKEYNEKIEEAKKKPSAGLTKKQKSTISKKAHAGKDIGKKGKGFEKVAKAAGGGEKGEKIAAAAMWKSEAKKAKKAKSLKEEVLALFENEILNEEVKSVDQALDNSKVQAASEKLAQDPALLQKAIGELTKLGIDKNTLVKAAQAHKAGQSVDNILEPKIEKASATLKEEEEEFTPDEKSQIKAAGKGGAKVGGALGAIVGFLGVGIIGPAALPLALVTAAVLGALGAAAGRATAKGDTKNNIQQSPERRARELINQMGKDEALKHAEQQQQYRRSFPYFGSDFGERYESENWWRDVVDIIKSSNKNL